MGHKHNGFATEHIVSKSVAIRTMAEMNCLINHMLAEMAQAGFSEREQFGVRLAVEEAIVNGIKHGNREDPAKIVMVNYAVNAREIITAIEDQGPGFNPNKVPDPLAPENIESPGGRGVFLMRHYMTAVHFNERGNRVTLSKTRDP